MKIITDIRAFIAAKDPKRLCANQWFSNAKMQVYIRVSRRLTPFTRDDDAAMVDTLEIANVEVMKRWRGQMIFSVFLEEIERLAKELNYRVYIENVMPSEFQEFFRSRGYLEDPATSFLPCFWSPKSS